ncbi:MAG: extracellular solute-binding protein [Lachnospiraceae bacterium]|nr:extracellular solute-binding protein [Lachnospiraceae bacterium]
MKKLQKVITLVLAFVLVFALVACAGTTTETPVAESPEVEVEETEEADAPEEVATGETTELTLWHIQTHELRAAVIEDAVNRFMEANPQYTVEIVPIQNDVYKETITIAMAANALPDVFVSWSGGPMIEYINAGHLYDMTDFVAASDLPDRLLEAGMAQGTYNGSVYGIPGESVAISAVFYNREIFDDLGLSVPTTVGEMEDVAETLIENDIIPFALANGPRWTGSMYFMNLATRYAGLSPFQNAVSGTGSFEDGSFVFAGERIADWVERDFFAPGFNGADEDTGQSRQLLYADQAAMHIIGNWFISQVLSENPDFHEKLGVFSFPAYENSDANSDIVIGTVGDNFYHIASTSVSPQGSFELITFITDETAMAGRIDAGAIPPIQGVTVEDPILQAVLSIIEEASEVQLWYDQYLPPEVAQAHLNTLQEIFGLTMTPQEANAEVQAAMESYRDR